MRKVEITVTPADPGGVMCVQVAKALIEHAERILAFNQPGGVWGENGPVIFPEKSGTQETKHGTVSWEAKL